MENKIVIFDLDGTLYKTEKTSVPALKKAFSKFDIDLSERKILGQFGEPTEVIIENLTPEDKLGLKDEIREEIVRNEREMISSEATLYNGTKEMLEELEGEGYELAICSNGREDYILEVLRATSMEDKFSSIKSYKDDRSKADLIEELMNEFSTDYGIMIGDRYHDIEAAKTVGIPNIGARYGYGGKEMEEADLVVSDPKDIPSLIQKIF
ncbi:MAG: HAD family hydrolase [Candidatus Thermoplasmatota archaeon]|nr:HAD family hydrolase [Candidatus Thermoplasmatota archaeon]